MARLVLSTAEGQQVVDLRPINSLGRHPNNSIQLLDKIVSKEHCIIEQRGDIFVLRDLGSLNGTYINASRVNGEQALRGGDEITMGGTRARFDDGTTSGMSAGSMPPLGPPGPGVAGWAPAAPPPVQHTAPVSYGGGPTTQPAGNHGAYPQGSQMPQAPQGSQMPYGGYPPQTTPLAPNYGGAPQHPSGAGSTRIEVQAQDRAIGTQIAAEQKGFQPFEAISGNAAQLRDDYERLRLSHELSRDIAMERDTTRLLEKVLAAVFKITRADRGVIFLKDAAGVPQGMVSRRRDGSDVPITVSSTIMNKVMQERTAVLTHDAAMDFSNAKGRSMILNRISSAIVAPFIYKDEVLGILWIDSESLAMFQPKDLELVTSVANQAAMFIEINILGKKVEDEIVTRERMSRLLSPNVAERIVSGALTIQKGGSLVKECTVFNSDIRGFTRMSEGAQPQAVVEMLNEYFEEMVDSIFKHEGTLDKFMGDGIMAIWGAPVVHNDDALRSVASSLEQMELLGKWNRKRGGTGQPPIAVGIGIHTGELVAGYVGSSRALSYTVIGDTVNTSARLCGIANAGQIVVSETTYARLGGRFEVEELPPANLKGKERPLRIYNVIRERPMAQVPGTLERLPTPRMATLSSLVAARGVATMAEVEEAITRQVLHGGDLTTSLLEIVDRTREPALTGVLAEHLGLAPTFSPLPPASPELLRLLPADLARRHTIYPIAWTQRSLTVAVTELLPDEAAGDLSFVLGRSIVQAAAPLVRIREALARDYQVALDRRMLRLLARLDGQRDPSPSSLPPPRRRRTEDGPLPHVPSIPSMAVPTPVFGGFRRETLAGFAALPKTVRLPSAPPPVALPSRASDVPPRPTPAEVPVAKRSEIPAPPPATQVPAVEAPRPEAVPSTASASASAPQPVPSNADAHPAPDTSAPTPLVPAPEGSVMVPARAREVMSWARTAIVHGKSTRKRRRGPMSMAEAESGIADAADAPEAIEVFFDFAQQYFEYSALFFLQGDVAGGRDAYGPGADRQKVNGIGIPLDLPSRFAEVRKSGAPWVGKAAREGLEAEVVADLERPAGLPFALVPVVVRGRTVALFYADEGGAVVELSMAGETLGLAGLLAKGLERIAVEKKARRGGTGHTVVDLPRAAPPPDRTTEVVEVPEVRGPLPTAPLVTPEGPSSALSPPRTETIVDVTRPSEMPSTIPGPPSAVSPRSQEPPSTEPEPVAANAIRGSRPPAPRFLPVSEMLAGNDATSTPIAFVTGMEWSRPAPSPPSAPAEPPPRSRQDTPRAGPLNAEQADLLRALLAPDARVGEILPLVVRQGAAMVAALVAALPGPTDVPRASVMAGDARPSHTGPIFRALVALRRVSLPHVIAASASSDTAYRFFSTFLLGELPFEGSPEAIAARLFDPDHDVQRIAVVAARLLGPTRPIAEPVIRRLEDVLGDGADQLSRRRRAASVLGELHARVAVPGLLRALDSPIAESAHGALVAITCQDFGTDPAGWLIWWEQQHKKHRVAWLIDALVHRSPDLRVRAAEELRTLAPRSGLSRVATASDEELAELHRRYLTWWRESGHAEAAALDE